MPDLHSTQSQLFTSHCPDKIVRYRTTGVRLSEKFAKFHYFRAAKTNIMRLQKALIYLIIFIIFLLGVYEIRSGNVGDFAYYKNSTEPIYVTIPGDWLIIGAIGLFIVISHTFYKVRN